MVIKSILPELIKKYLIIAPYYFESDYCFVVLQSISCIMLFFSIYKTIELQNNWGGWSWGAGVGGDGVGGGVGGWSQGGWSQGSWRQEGWGRGVVVGLKLP